MIWARQAYIARPLAAVNLPFGADRALPKVIEDALQTGRDFDDERAIFLEIEISKSVDDVGVRCSNQRLGVQPLFEDRQDVIAFAEDLFVMAYMLSAGNAQR